MSGPPLSTKTSSGLLHSLGGWLTGIPSLRAASGPRLTSRLTGGAATDGSPLRIVTDLTGDVLAYWSGLLFAAPPTCTSLGAHGLMERLARGRDADLALLRHHRALRARARRAGYQTAPTWLDTGAAIGSTVAETLGHANFALRSQRSDIRRVQRAEFTPRLVRDPIAIRHFLSDWYLPYVRARWGALCTPLDRDTMCRMPQDGELLWIMQGSGAVGGVLLESRGSVLRMVAVGIRGEAERRTGALAAAYYFAIGEAVRRGATLLRTGGTRPVLSDRVLEFKRKWGVGIRAALQWDYLAVGCGAWSPTVRALLTRHPIVVESADARFYAVTDPDAAAALPSRKARGMLRVHGMSGLVWPAGNHWCTSPVPAATPAAGLASVA